MLMDLLLASRSTEKYLLPFHIYNKQERDFKPEEEKAYIAMPAKGAKLSRIIYAQPEAGSERVGGTQYFKKGHICDYIDASLCQKRWLFIETPELLTHNNHPNVARIHLQKNAGSVWSIIERNLYPANGFEQPSILENIDKASLTVINHVNRYLLDLSYGFIDFIISADGNPYFLHFGGFTFNLFNQKKSDDFYKDFYRNLINLAGEYSRMRRRD